MFLFHMCLFFLYLKLPLTPPRTSMMSLQVTITIHRLACTMIPAAKYVPSGLTICAQYTARHYVFVCHLFYPKQFINYFFFLALITNSTTITRRLSSTSSGTVRRRRTSLHQLNQTRAQNRCQRTAPQPQTVRSPKRKKKSPKASLHSR